MPTNVKPTFLDQLRSSGLLEPEQLKELAGLPEAKQADPLPLARQVFQRGWLSKYQINQVGAGRSKELLIGPYLLVDRLGEGGMGTVFKARHRHMGRVVALKIIRKEKLASPDAVQRFYREVQAAAHLTHPNIVLAYDAGQDGSTHFLSMEYVDGTDLARLVRESGPLPVAAACEYVRQAALGLQHAHERGLIHRDIKPHNLLLTHQEGPGKEKGPVIKILDMGLALRGGPDKERAITQTGAVIGTPDFIAPEQAINSRAADIRADLYSLGCTLYFLLTGRAPFQGETLTQVLLQHQMEEATPLEQLRADTPPSVAAVVRKLMAKRPEDRFQTPAELVQVLEALAQGKTYAIQAEPAASAAALPPPTDPAVDPFWNTIVDGSDAPAESALDSIDRTESGARFVRGSRGKRTSAKEKTRSTGGLTRNQKLGLAVGGGVFAVLLLIVGIIALVSGGGNTTDNTDRDSQVVKKGADVKKDAGEKPREPLPGGEIRLFKGHSSRVNAVAFSPDRALALSGGEDRTLRLWDLGTGKELHRISDFKEGIKSVAFAADGKHFFASTGDKGLREWDLASWQEIGAPRDGVLLSPNGGYSATISPAEQEALVRVRELATQRERRQVAFRGSPGAVRVAFSAGDRRVVVAGPDGTLIFFEFQTGQGGEVKTAAGPSRCLAVSPDGNVVVLVPEPVGGVAPPAQVWSLSEKRRLREFEKRGQGLLRALAFAPNGRHLVSGGADGSVRVWDAGTGRELTHYPGHTGPVQSVAVAASGREALSAGEDGSVRLWGVTTLLPADEGPGNPPGIVVQGEPPAVSGSRLLKANGTSRALAMSPDGRRLATVTPTATLEVWALPEGRREHAWPAPPGIQAAKLVFTPDGSQAVWSSSGSGTLFAMDLATGKIRQSDKVASLYVEDLAISPDGRRALTAGGLVTSVDGKRVDSNNEVHLWDLEKLKHVAAWAGHTSLVHNVAFVEGGRAVSCAEDGIRVWDIARGQEIKHFVTERVYRGACSPSGRLLLFRSPRTTHLWDVAEGREIKQLTVMRDSVFDMAFAGEGRVVVAYGAFARRPPGTPATERPRPIPGRCVLRVWDVKTGRVLRVLKDHGNPVWRVVCSADGRFAASQDLSGELRLWDLEGQGLPPGLDRPPVQGGPSKVREAKRFEGHTKEITTIAISRDGRRVLSGSNDETVRLWEVATGKELRRIPHVAPVYRVAFTPNGRFVIVVSTDRKIHLWDLINGVPRGSIAVPRTMPYLHELVFAPDGQSLLVCGPAGFFSLLSLASGKEVGRFEGHTDNVECVAFSRDGHWVVSGSKDRTIRIWEAKTGKVRKRFEGHTDRVMAVAFSPDGKQVYSASFDKTLRTWDVATGKEVANANTGLNFVRSVVIDPESGRALVSGSDTIIRVWDLKTGKEVCLLEGHTAMVWALAFSADGKRALTSGDFTVRLWDLPQTSP
jgi:WD40 repeat protein/serine/threonine protein kinase